MHAILQSLNGGFLKVTPSGQLVATAIQDDATLLELSGDGTVPTLVRDVASGRFLSVNVEGDVTVLHLGPDLAGSALVVHPGALLHFTTVSLYARNFAGWLSARAGDGLVVGVRLAEPGRPEMFNLVAPPIPIVTPVLPGSEAAAGSARGSQSPPRVGGWRQCGGCGVLFDSTATHKACPAQLAWRPNRPTNHVEKDATNYSLEASDDKRFNGRLVFRRCHDCAGLLHLVDGGSEGPCVVGKPAHSRAGSLFYAPDIPAADPPLRRVTRWRVCTKCRLLFHDDGGASVCAVGDAHDAGDSDAYVVRVAPQA